MVYNLLSSPKAAGVKAHPGKGKRVTDPAGVGVWAQAGLAREAAGS